MIAALQTFLFNTLARPLELIAQSPLRSLSVAGVGATLGLASSLITFPDYTCKAPGVRQVCAVGGIGGVPRWDDTKDWEAARDSGRCEAIQAYLRRPEPRAYAPIAQQVLSGARSVPTESWTAERRSPAFAVRRNLEPIGSEADARAWVLGEARREAQAACRRQASTADFRLVRADLARGDYLCAPFGGGFSCGYDGEAACEIQVRSMHASMDCSFARKQR